MSALSDLFTNIANAIRAKSGSSETITATNFPTAISNIPSGAEIFYVEADNAFSIQSDYLKTDKNIRLYPLTTPGTAQGNVFVCASYSGSYSSALAASSNTTLVSTTASLNRSTGTISLVGCYFIVGSTYTIIRF